MHWLLFVLLTIVCWGVYGNLMHTGSLAMNDPQLGRIKSFFWVGVAYFITAVLLPALWIVKAGGSWKMPTAGVIWSLLGGTAGAVGAFGAILGLGAAFAAKVASPPLVVMSLIFAGAPLVSGLHSLMLHPVPFKQIDFRFILGGIMAVTGGYLVARYKPAGAPPAKAPPVAAAAAVHFDTSKYKIS